MAIKLKKIFRKLFRYIRYMKLFREDAKALEAIICKHFEELGYTNNRIKVKFTFGYNTDVYTHHFYDKKKFGIIRIDHQNNLMIWGFSTIPEYIKSHKKLKTENNH